MDQNTTMSLSAMSTETMATKVKSEPLASLEYQVPDWSEQWELDTTDVLLEDTFIGVTDPVRPNAGVEFVVDHASTAPQYQQHTEPLSSCGNSSFSQLVQQPTFPTDNSSNATSLVAVSPCQSYGFRNRTFSSGQSSWKPTDFQFDAEGKWIEDVDLSDMFDETELQDLGQMTSPTPAPYVTKTVPIQASMPAPRQQLMPRASVVQVQDELEVLLEQPIDKGQILQEIVRECESLERVPERPYDALSPSDSFSSYQSADSSRATSPVSMVTYKAVANLRTMPCEAKPRKAPTGGVKRRSRDEARERKREQNRVAALKYRLKKKEEKMMHGSTVESLERENARLKGQEEDILYEMRCLKKLMTDIGIPISEQRAKMAAK